MGPCSLKLTHLWILTLASRTICSVTVTGVLQIDGTYMQMSRGVKIYAHGKQVFSQSGLVGCVRVGCAGRCTFWQHCCSAPCAFAGSCRAAMASSSTPTENGATRSNTTLPLGVPMGQQPFFQ